jgi:acetolactate synthase-1/2/3 large subunit
MTKGSDLSVAALKNAGAERNFRVYGEEDPDVVESLHGSRIEEPGAFKAATYGRLTGKPGVCISALGPGMLNFCFISKVPS